MQMFKTLLIKDIRQIIRGKRFMLLFLILLSSYLNFNLLIGLVIVLVFFDNVIIEKETKMYHFILKRARKFCLILSKCLASFLIVFLFLIGSFLISLLIGKNFNIIFNLVEVIVFLIITLMVSFITTKRSLALIYSLTFTLIYNFIILGCT